MRYSTCKRSFLRDVDLATKPESNCSSCSVFDSVVSTYRVIPQPLPDYLNALLAASGGELPPCVMSFEPVPGSQYVTPRFSDKFVGFLKLRELVG